MLRFTPKQTSILSLIVKKNLKCTQSLLTGPSYRASVTRTFGYKASGELNKATTHFKATPTPHPLKAVPIGDHIGLQQNHIWTKEELDEKLTTLYHHRPKTITDHFVHNFVRN